MKEGRERYFVIKHLISNIRCAVCSERYEPKDVRILGHQDDLWIMGVTCSHCDTQGMIFAVVREGQPPEVITEMTPEELARIPELSPLDVDDVLDMHRLLRDFKGDFHDLVGENEA
ncbi:MAG: hypothetical protein MUP04_06650 [Anaerolineae bacterium]|nr:hypothetical protein [Anaerolineae bacterium]